MATAQELIAWAASQIGVKESPAGSNKVKYWDTYKQDTGANFQGSPWCAAFVSCGMWHVGMWPTGKDEARFRYCPSLVNWAKQNGRWRDRKAIAQPGWIVLFANKGTACHVGFVEKNVDDNTLQTIEGNTSVTSNDNGGSVMRRTRKYGTVGSDWYILGFVEPEFSMSTAVSSSGVPSWLVQEVLAGKWGNDPQRSEKLKAAGYDPAAVKSAVNAAYKNTAPAETSGHWVQDSKGWWWKYPDGTWPRNQWMLLKGIWYWFKDDGYAAERECLKVNGKWYAFDGNCYMMTSVKVNKNGDLAL